MPAVPKPITVYFPKYRRSFREQECTVETCALPGSTGEVVGHHLLHSKNRDDWLIALCGRHHQGHPESVHVAAVEAVWWATHAPDFTTDTVTFMLDQMNPQRAHQFHGDIKGYAAQHPDIIMDGLKMWCELAHTMFQQVQAHG